MISAKGLRSNPANPADPDKHELKEETRRSRWPALIGLMLVSLVFYLRSFLPVETKTLEADSPPRKPPVDTDDNEGRAPSNEAALATASDQTQNETQSRFRPSPDEQGEAIAGPAVMSSRLYPVMIEATVLKPAELKYVTSFARPANTNVVGMPYDSIRNFPAAQPSVTTSDLSDDVEYSNAGNESAVINPYADAADDDDDDATPIVRNRAPRNSGPVYLADVGSTATLAIALAQLLSHSTDEDGDTLSVRNLRATSGEVKSLPDRTWLFTPSPTNLGRVVFSFEVWDGYVAVPQQAYSMVTNAPTDTGGGVVDGDDICVDQGEDYTGYNLVIGGAGDDVLIGTDGNDLIKGNAGNDVAYGGHGDDVMYGGDGRDHMSGGAGDDQLYGEADEDILFGDDGNDLLDGGAASDILFGGAGHDILFGGDGDDVLSGGDGADQMSGGAGTDEMMGDEGNDIMFGDAGADLMLGGAGSDVMFGGDDGDALYGGDGADAMYGGAGHDVVSDGAGTDVVHLEAGDDRMLVSIDMITDYFDGGEGNDTLDYSHVTDSVAFDLVSGAVTVGDGDSDHVSGFETYVGGSGDDRFVCGDGPATLSGGKGNDLFQFVAQQKLGSTTQSIFQITDFDVGDRLRISDRDFFKDLADHIEDEMDSYFSDDGNSGRGSDGPAIRLRHDRDADDHETTWIEIDFDRDEFFETTITMQGHHLFVVVENA